MEKKICTVIISMLSQIVGRHNQRKTFPYIVIRGSFVSVCVFTCVAMCEFYSVVIWTYVLVLTLAKLLNGIHLVNSL